MEFSKRADRLCRRVTRGEKGGGSFPCPFSKIGKLWPNLHKKCPGCGHLWIKSFIYNETFKSFQPKKQEMVTCGAFLSCVVGKCLSKCPNSKKDSTALKKYWLRPAVSILSLWIASHSFKFYFGSEICYNENDSLFICLLFVIKGRLMNLS